MKTKDAFRCGLSELASLSLIVGMIFAIVPIRGADPPYQGPHLWLETSPGTYVYSNPDPWLEDSWVDPLVYAPNGAYDAALVVANLGPNTADTFLLVAIPDSTTEQMFSFVRVSGGADGTRTFVLADFGRTDYNPYTHQEDEPGGPIMDPYRPYGSGSHGVYPPSGNANWATYHIGDLGGHGGFITLAVTLTLGPMPSDAFKVHFDSYSLVYGSAGTELQYWVPPSHDANMASEVLLQPIPADAVDVSGNNNYVALGYGKYVSFFETFAQPESRLKWTRDTGYQVFSVALSEDGDYLAVASNEVPPTGLTHAYLSLYRTSDATLIVSHQLDYNTVKTTRALDISRDGRYVAAGTAGWQQGYNACRSDVEHWAKGTVWLFDNPDLVPGAAFRKYREDDDCVMSVRFSGNTQHLVAGFWWSSVADVVSVPDLAFETSTWNTGDRMYATAISYDGSFVSTGEGIHHRVRLWAYTPGNPALSRVWTSDSSVTNGGHGRQVISDDGQYVFTKQEAWSSIEVPAYHLFNSSVPPDPYDKHPEWTYEASYVFPIGADFGIADPVYAIGAEGMYVHIWGDGAEPLSNTRYDRSCEAITTDAAMSYSSEISAATDNAGNLYVFETSRPGDKLLWSWHT